MAMTPRTVLVTELCPAAMRKRDVWRIDQFSLLKKIGSGYASSVYMAICRATGHHVAIKMYHRNKLSELNHFQVAREVRIHASLSHRNIIGLWAAFEDQYGIYLVSEFASKGDVFADVEKHGGSMTEEETVKQVIYPFLQALIYLHGRGIMHRDIKPENLLLTGTGILKVADFGLSINFHAERPVTRVGTLDYMAPEVVICPDKHKPSDHKHRHDLAYSTVVDSWAVGVLAYELIVGRPPFDKGHKKLTMVAIVNGEPAMPSSVSEGAAAFIRWAVTKDKTRRPSVQQLAEHPWVMGHLRPAARHMQAPHLRAMHRADSFVDVRPVGLGLGLSSGGSCSGDAAGVEASPEEMLQHLQLRNVQKGAGSRALWQSNSMTAVDMLRWRDLAFNANTAEQSDDSYFSGPSLAVAAAALGASPVKRKSDGHDEEHSVRASFAMAGKPMPPAGPGQALSRQNSIASSIASGAATPGGAGGSPVKPGSASPCRSSMTREEVFANLQASAAKLNRSGSFTSRLGSSGIPPVPSRSPALQRDLKRSQSSGQRSASPISHHKSHGAGLASGQSLPGTLPLPQAAGHSPSDKANAVGGLRGVPPSQSPITPRSSHLFASSPSRLSASFSSPNSPLASSSPGIAAIGAMPSSRLVQGSGPKLMLSGLQVPLCPPKPGSLGSPVSEADVSISPESSRLQSASLHCLRSPNSGLVDSLIVCPDGRADPSSELSDLDASQKNGAKGLFGSLKKILA